jgi:ADP-ribosylglycohydrolase
MDARRPSRTKSIEELPIALGLALVAGGTYREAVLGAVNYGRDSDSIATMAGAITGALGGAAEVPAEWLDEVTRASKIDLVGPATTLVDVATDIWQRDTARASARDSARRSLR